MFFSNSIANKKGFLPRPARFRACSDDTTGTTNIPGLPNIYGGISDLATWPQWANGPFSFTTSGYYVEAAPAEGHYCQSAMIVFDGHAANDIYGASQTVMPSSINLPIVLYMGIAA